MKMYRKFILFLLVGQLAFAYSCKKDDDNTVQKPTLTVTTDKSSAAVGETVNINITASGPSGVNLKSMKIEEVIAGTSGTVVLKDSTLKAANIGYTYAYTIPSGASGTKEVKVTVTDNNSQTTTKSVSITVTASSAALRDCGTKVLGNQQSTTGSFFATSNCTVYTVSQAQANQNIVDFVHYFGATNNATIAAPNDAGANQFTTFQLNTWSNKNATTFKKVLNFNYDAATTATVQDAWNNGGTAMSSATDLNVGNNVVFKTASGKYGVFQVAQLSGNSTTSGTMTIKVKAQ